MREQDPVFYDALFRQKRKGGKWRVMPSPVLEGPVADTHAHLQMLADPACELARAGAHGVAFVETIVDPAEDGFATFDDLPLWLMEAARDLKVMEEEDDGAAGIVAAPAVPHVRIAAGVHPHNAKEWGPVLEAALREYLRDRRVSAVGEIGLDYHYDLSPRDVQQEVFRAQIRLAKEAGLPIALHMREAHDDGFAILEEEGFPEAGTLLHCFNLDAAEVARWVEAGCYIAFGGPLTFKRADEVREAAALVPADRLLTETDAPYMTPEPMRGMTCLPDHVLFTAERLAEACGRAPGAQREEFLARLMDNARELLDRPATAWQKNKGA